MCREREREREREIATNISSYMFHVCITIVKRLAGALSAAARNLY